MNNSLKANLRSSLVTPAVSSRSVTFYDAIVTKVNERTNSCTIQYKNEKGILVTQNNVPVQLANINIIDWFPRVDDKVQAVNKEGVVYINGPSYAGHYESIRTLTKLKEDVFTDSSNYFVGGSIF